MSRSAARKRSAAERARESRQRAATRAALDRAIVVGFSTACRRGVCTPQDVLRIAAARAIEVLMAEGETRAAAVTSVRERLASAHLYHPDAVFDDGDATATSH